MPKFSNKGIYTRATTASHRPSSDVYYVPGCRPEGYSRVPVPVKVSREEARQTITLWRLWVLVWNPFYFCSAKNSHLGVDRLQLPHGNRTRAAYGLDVRLCPQPDDVCARLSARDIGDGDHRGRARSVLRRRVSAKWRSRETPPVLPALPRLERASPAAPRTSPASWVRPCWSERYRRSSFTGGREAAPSMSRNGRMTCYSG
jgi:hypothetical protein